VATVWGFQTIRNVLDKHTYILVPSLLSTYRCILNTVGFLGKVGDFQNIGKVLDKHTYIYMYISLFVPTGVF